MNDLALDLDETLTIGCHLLENIEACADFMLPTHNFKTLTLNIRSIQHNFDAFLVILKRSKVKFDLIVLTECWLNENTFIPHLPGFTAFHTIKYINKSGGVVAYVGDSWNVQVDESTCEDCNCLEINFGAEFEWQWCLIRRTLDGLPVTVPPAAEPHWELFHAHQLRKALAACDIPTGTGGKRISVSRVHALLSSELASLHASAPQRNLVAMEIQKVLDYVTEVNSQRNLAATITHYYDSWRQLTEILFCVAPPDMLPLESKKNLLLNILQDLLNKIPPAEVLPQLGNLASGTVLLLLVNLRHCYLMQKRDTNLNASEFETSFFGSSNQIMHTKSLSLKFILHKILSWILVSGASQKMRVNLYGALLNFLNIVNLKPYVPDQDEDEVSNTYVSLLDSSLVKPSKEDSALKCMVVDVISGFGEQLCSVVCGDCVGGGQEVCRMVALSCLEALVDMDPRSPWLPALTTHGYLRSLIDSLLQDDSGLMEALEPNPKSLRVLYLGALHSLANLKVLSRHPDLHTAKDRALLSDFLPPVTTRFRQMLVPALALCDALLNALSSDNHSCVLHVTHFLLSHADCADLVLRALHPDSPEDLVIEAEALSSVLARTATPAALDALTSLEGGAALQRLHALALALLSGGRLQHGPGPNRALRYKVGVRPWRAAAGSRLALNPSAISPDQETIMVLGKTG
ncbi:hypothetical protein ACJJTC_009837 [Scirpophaga incertulas]